MRPFAVLAFGSVVGWGAGCASAPVAPGAPASPIVASASASASARPAASVPSVEAVPKGLDARDFLPMPEAIPAERAFVEADAALGRASLGAKALDEGGGLTVEALARLDAAGFDEDKSLGWIAGMAPACQVPAGGREDSECRVPNATGGFRGRELFRRAIAAAGARGSRRTARVFARLQAGGVADVSDALGALLRGRHTRRTDAKGCRPPSAETVAEEEKKLDDFVVLEEGPKGLRGRALTATERGDLAYFFASIGAGHRRETTALREVAAPSLEADRKAQIAALAEGDLETARNIARAAFKAWGLDKPADAGDDAVPPAALAPFAFDAGVVFELLGDDVEAARAYRASLGGRAKSMVRPLFARLDRGDALLRMDEASGACGDSVFPRLRRGLLRPQPEAGPARLKANGFDVPRLYRGGLLTAHRSPFLETTKLGGLTPAQRSAFDARAKAHGLEDFDHRGRLLEGLADELGAAAIPMLVATARDKVKGPEERTRALAVLSSLLREPDVDPCVEPAPFQPMHMYERSVGSLNAVCATRLSNEEAKRLADEVAQLSTDRDKDVRWSAVVALDAFERDPAGPALERFLKDAFSVAGAPPEERRPIAVIAERALFRRSSRKPP